MHFVLSESSTIGRCSTNCYINTWLLSSFSLSFPSSSSKVLSLLLEHKSLHFQRTKEKNWNCQHFETHYQGSKTKNKSRPGMHNAAVASSSTLQPLPRFEMSRTLYISFFSVPLALKEPLAATFQYLVLYSLPDYCVRLHALCAAGHGILTA